MAAEILAILAVLNITLSAAIVLVLALRRPMRRWCGADAVYGLWTTPPVAGLLILAFVFVLRLAFNERGAGMHLATDPLVAHITASGLAKGLFGLWLTGVVIGLGFLALAERRVMRLARAGKIGPAVVGVISPRIYLPADFEDRYTSDEQAMIRAHEISHLLRHDVLVNAWVALAQCLLWFNPIVHLAARSYRHDQEMACDAAVMEEFPERRRRYAAAMLKTQLMQCPMGVACGWSGHPLEMRIATLKRGTPPSFLRISMALGASALAMAVVVATLSMSVGVFEQIANINSGQAAFSVWP